MPGICGTSHSCLHCSSAPDRVIYTVRHFISPWIVPIGELDALLFWLAELLIRTGALIICDADHIGMHVASVVIGMTLDDDCGDCCSFILTDSDLFVKSLAVPKNYICVLNTGLEF